jgi:autophagy-related protein 2
VYQAINTLITGLPIQLHDGSVGKVTARIPWPNPLTSAVGLSLESLHLTFMLSSTPPKAPSRSTAAELAESVASVAETFIHDELDAQEEAALLGSFHSDLSSSNQSVDRVPGGLDPFLSEGEPHPEGEPAGVSIFATLVERLLSRFEFDSTDLKVTLVHPEHASFTLHVPSIHYRTEVKEGDSQNASSSLPLPIPEGVARTVSVSGVTVTTRSLRPPSPQSTVSRGSPLISPLIHQDFLAFSREIPSPTSSLSNSSDLDEETTMLMSQSMAMLPPRPSSPSSSVASSMYQSAVSIVSPDQSGRILQATSRNPDSPFEGHIALETTEAPTNIRPQLAVTVEEIDDEMLVSFGHDAITLRLWTPSPVHSTSHTKQPAQASASPQAAPEVKAGERKESGALKVDVTIGLVAVALRARHIRSLLDVADLWASHTPAVRRYENSSRKEPRPFAQHIDASLYLRGVIVALLPGRSKSSVFSPSLSDFFKSPLVPPRLPHGYVRLHLEELSTKLSVCPTTPSTIRHTSYPGTTITSHVSVTEVSAFAFILSSNYANGVELAAIPIFITDPNLRFQYDSSHIHPDLRQPDSDVHLPTFEVIDWTDPSRWSSSARLSSWRTKLPHGRVSSPLHSPRDIIGDRETISLITSSSPRQHGDSTSFGRSPPSTKLPPQHSALTANITITSMPLLNRSRSKRNDSNNRVDVNIDTAPLHLFLDATQVLSGDGSERSEMLSFVDELTSSSDAVLGPVTATGGRFSDDEDEDEDEAETPPGTPGAHRRYLHQQQEIQREAERRRLERLVLEDLDLGLNYSQLPTSNKGAQKPYQATGRRKVCYISTLSLFIGAYIHIY